MTNPATQGDDSTPDDNAIIDQTNPPIDQGDDSPDGQADDTGSDSGDDGIHPDALDQQDEDEIDLSDDDLKDSSRLKGRFKQLTSRANRAKDLEMQNQLLLEQIESLKKVGDGSKKPDTSSVPDDDYTEEQLVKAKQLMDKLGYVPKNEVESLKQMVQKLSNRDATLADNRMMEEAIAKYTDEKGNPIVTERHIKNALRTWINSDNPLVRKRAELDYDAVIQLIGGAKITKVIAKKKPAPKIAASNGEPIYQPEKPEPDSYNPGDPIGSKQKLLSRILSSFE